MKPPERGLVLTRRIGEAVSIMVGDEMVNVRLVQVRGKSAKFRIEGDRTNVKVWRAEHDWREPQHD